MARCQTHYRGTALARLHAFGMSARRFLDDCRQWVFRVAIRRSFGSTKDEKQAGFRTEEAAEVARAKTEEAVARAYEVEEQVGVVARGSANVRRVARWLATRVTVT